MKEESLMKKRWFVVPFVLIFASAGAAYADSVGFSDVPPTHWASAAISRLAQAGIVHGYADGTFQPDNTITRAEVAQMIDNEHTAMENELKQVQSQDNAVTNTVAGALPSVVVIHADNKLGAGVFVDAKHIVTADHVVSGTSKVEVTSAGGSPYNATVTAEDSDKDLALLEVGGGPAGKPVALAASVEVGETAIAIGHPDGLNYSVSKGIVSNAGRQLADSDAKLIQFDTAISPGNSGGPLIDIDGKLLGIVDEKVNAKASEGLGFAISLDEVKAFLQRNGL
jgi:S1-C subfamily serine protease